MKRTSSSRDEQADTPVTESLINCAAPSDQFLLRSREMATLLPEQLEALEAQTVQLQLEGKAGEVANSFVSKPVEVMLLDLPLEILTHILLLLPFTSVVICRGVNRHLKVLISESIGLQYYIHLGVSGLVDNPCCGLAVSERLDRLLTRERCLEELNHDFDRIVSVPVVAEWERRRLSGGVFSLLHRDGTLHEVRIPNKADQEIKWREARPEQMIISSAMRVCEHDLYIFITAQPRVAHTNVAEPYTIHEVQVHLNQSSTGEPHPDAQGAIFFETREPFEEPRFAMECTGDNLLLVLRDEAGTITKPDGQVYVYEWKTGRLKMRFSAPYGSYLYPLFLTTHIFLLPNATTGELEYWRIPQHPSEPPSDKPFFILSLPRLCSGRYFDEIICSAEPSPTDGPRGAPNPFHTNPDHAIVIFAITIRHVRIHPSSIYFALFVHRSSLMECLGKFFILNSSGQRPKSVPYEDWGPLVCRWFTEYLNDYMMERVWGTFGQRYTALAYDRNAPVVVFNFNRIDVMKVMAAEKHISGAKKWDGDGRNMDRDKAHAHAEGEGPPDKGEEQEVLNKCGGRVSSQVHETTAVRNMSRGAGPSSFELQPRARAVVRAMDPLDDPDCCFEDTVYSSLPYTIRSSKEKYRFGSLQPDEEYILGTVVRIALFSSTSS
ncbi:hypothetical protein P691DRAFT_791217 [Macrolepiota fuliginosa MF-IS2]|uniref:F-box domain-containing protein n=1 Tax=Macrolepiota fuliginosa MF-IS2 TaxID=1400762 RepID=A0A9P5XDC9_9AGAR|nr:hypothetical protein P691DRAFT_791217 [Macrolepiota fuliginosa MF-IS2]